jgi:histidinol phosphatase-like PHP family hydrolase
LIDLHVHSIFSDGELIPAELVRRAKMAGYQAFAITDHGDWSNIDFIVPRVVKVCQVLSDACEITVIPGIELTHIPPDYIFELSRESRNLGAKIVVVHGETIVEPVMPGTNMAALQSPIDILAHPGLLTEAEAKVASRENICLEISARKGHCLANGHVVKIARQCKAPLILNTDTHAPHDFVTLDMARKIAVGAGLTEQEVDDVFRNSELLVRKIFAG